MSFIDAVCWAFDKIESELDDILWTLARREIQSKIQLKLGEKNAMLLSQHNSMVMIINAALGGSGSGGGPKPANVKDIGVGHASPEAAAAAINAAMFA